MKKLILPILLIISAFCYNLYSAKALNLDSERQIIMQLYANVTGDEQEEIIILSGINKSNSSLYENLKINVFEDKSGKLLFSVIPTVNYGFNPNISALNFSEDGYSQIFYKSDADDKNSNVYVYAFNLQNAVTLYDFEVDTTSFSAKHIDYYKVLVSCGDKNYKVDISSKGKNYLSKLYFENGKLQKQSPARVSNNINAYPYKSGNKFYLAVIREVTGETVNDVICNPITILELKDGKFADFDSFIKI